MGLVSLLDMSQKCNTHSFTHVIVEISLIYMCNLDSKYISLDLRDHAIDFASYIIINLYYKLLI
jgi:hypothetical protein